MLEGMYNFRGNSFQKALESQLSSSATGLLGDDIQRDTGNHSAYKVGFLGAYNHHGFYSSATHQLTNWSAVYSISFNGEHLTRLLKTDFVSQLDSSMNLFFDRKYYSTKDSVAQRLSMRLGDFSSWLFGGSRFFSRFHLELVNDLGLDLQRQNDLAEDGDTLNKSFTINGYLTKTGSYKVFNEMPDLRIGRNFLNMLANRFQKEFTVYVDPKFQFYTQDNNSNHLFQNYVASYQHFIPAATVEYSNFQYSEYFDSYTLGFARSFDHPTPDQRVPLVDSASVYDIREGNNSLDPVINDELTFKFRHTSYRLKNTLNYGASVFAGVKNNFWADSLVVDLAGRNMYYTVNLNGNRYGKLSLFLNKAFILGSHQFQINASSGIGSFRYPGYSGYQATHAEGLSISNVFTNFDSVSFLYTYKDLVALNLLETISYYDSRQNGFSNAEFRNFQSLTRLGIAVNVTKRFSVNTNVSFNSSSYSYTPVEKFTIWNAFLFYRFLRTNNLELKLSALDILNQNKGIINSATNNSFNHGTVNLLHQYFMATVSYFPRKFGKRQPVKKPR
jgi:hypothetical protein